MEIDQSRDIDYLLLLCDVVNSLKIKSSDLP